MALVCSALTFFETAVCFALSNAFLMSASDLPLIAGDFIAGLPAASAPWQAAQFELYSALPSSAAHDRLGIATNSNRAIPMIRAASFVVFIYDRFLLDE